MKQTKALNKKQKQKKLVLATIAIGAAGVLGYFGFQYLRRKAKSKQGADLDEVLKSASTAAITDPLTVPANQPAKSKVTKAATSPGYSNAANTGFPLKKGSKGENVRLLQQALIARYGKSILPHYGADGDFGTETVNALKKAGLPVPINESTFNVLTQGAKTGKPSLGKELFAAVNAGDFAKALSVLKNMNSTEDYSAANDEFKTMRIAGGVRQTIVNGLLNTFSSDSQKEKIKFELLRMGLQYDGDKWSLSGFDGKTIITTETTTVWIDPAQGIKVPSRMVLGSEVSRRLDYTLFENKGKYFLVNSKSVQYL